MMDESTPDGWQESFESLGEVVPMPVLRVANGNAKRRRTAPSATAHVDASMPVIRMTAALHESVDSSVDALARDAEIYQRDAQLVRVVRVAEADAAREKMSAGTPQIRPVPIATLRERLTRVAHYEKYDARSGDWLAAIPNDRVVAAVDARGEWPAVRPLIGVLETPSMRPDGSILDAPGYDAATGYVYLPSKPYPAIPQRPSIEAARDALAELMVPWAEFPTRADAERYVPIAALMTLVARPAIRGACPAFLADASTRGSGKTLIAKALTTLAHGRPAAVMNWPREESELEKVLAGYALRAASVVCFDNVTSSFGGAPIDKVLTCSDRVELRILGKSEVPALSWRAVTIATGNNIVIGGDTTRRVLVCRLEPMMENPEERTGYAISNLETWCLENHPRLVAAALTVLRGYVVAERPAQGLAGWGSFEAWSDLIACAIVWAGGSDVTTCRPTIAGDDDPETAAMRAIIEHWASIAPTGATASSVLGQLYSPERMRGNAPPDGYDAPREALEVIVPPTKTGMAPNAIAVGKALGKFKGRVFGERRLEKSTRDDRSKTGIWVVREARR